MWNETVALLRKDFLLEFRQRHSLAALFVFVLSSVFVCYLAFQTIEESEAWGALLWVVGLFGAINAMAKTFFAEGMGVQLYLHTLAHPRSVILSKILFNTLLIICLNLLSLLLFLLFFGTKAVADADMIQFIGGLLIGSCALGTSLTLMAGIAFRAGNNLGLMAILAFPVLIPVLITLVRFSINSLEGISWGENLVNLSMLTVLLGSSLALALVLFPYLWRD